MGFQTFTMANLKKYWDSLDVKNYKNILKKLYFLLDCSIKSNIFLNVWQPLFEIWRPNFGNLTTFLEFYFEIYYYRFESSLQ